MLENYVAMLYVYKWKSDYKPIVSLNADYLGVFLSQASLGRRSWVDRDVYQLAWYVV